NTSARLNGPGTVSASQLFRPGAGPALLSTALLLMLAVVLSLTMLLRPVRVMLSRIMPIDPDNFVHTIALCDLTLVVLTSFVPLIALGGRPPLLEVIKQSSSQSNAEQLGLSASPLDLVYQFVWTIPATIVAAGWPVLRRFRVALERLGIVRPSTIQVAAG